MLALVRSLGSTSGSNTSSTSSTSDNNASDSSAVAYIIAGLHGDKSTLLHEWAHARFFLDASYRDLSHQLWDGLDTDARRAIEKELAMRNYRPDVFVDEFQAYVAENPEDFGKRWAPKVRDANRQLRQIINVPRGLL
ncbi:hypothetical protein BC831DRAFT_492294 [Entophlyctis helioformis]|nr:hypothetical protein BC831DRAFT_492294 [Entophlyctis helioformis]